MGSRNSLGHFDMPNGLRPIRVSDNFRRALVCTSTKDLRSGSRGLILELIYESSATVLSGQALVHASLPYNLALWYFSSRSRVGKSEKNKPATEAGEERALMEKNKKWTSAWSFVRCDEAWLASKFCWDTAAWRLVSLVVCYRCRHTSVTVTAATTTSNYLKPMTRYLVERPEHSD
ncbi:hypothetical protein KQX54_002411 [Cotesia glomerata]|uniref:Uncharacterized protein n=1 Tax=Cotesia glomerata TaxID=32391 RepID=A0AAV7I4T7_COTGL|nr:hypothetical protein KQX54_002411 [Cotesia glomerata]